MCPTSHGDGFAKRKERKWKYMKKIVFRPVKRMGALFSPDSNLQDPKLTAPGDPRAL
jgi:hypothetical protein